MLTVDIRQFEQFLIAIAHELQELKKFGVNVGNFVFPFSSIWTQSDLFSMNITLSKPMGASGLGLHLLVRFVYSSFIGKCVMLFTLKQLSMK